jgi:hypothetical protein
LLIAIPIIVHLYYFRRYKKVYFSNVKFLRNVQEEQSTWRRLRNLLVLLARILAVIFLVFAFAQPFIPADDQASQGRKAISIYIDNSFSMNARGADVPLLGQARQKALEIVRSQEVETEFQVLSNELSGVSRRWMNQEQAIGAIDDIEIHPTARNISEILAVQKRSFDNATADRHLRFILSDFQKSTADIESPADTTITTYFLPLEAVQTGNVAIDSVVLDAPIVMPNQTLKLFVKISNYDEQQDQRVRLSVNTEGETRPFGQRDIAAASSIWDTLTLSPSSTGWKKATVQITDYPVQFDDRYLLSFYVPAALPVLSIYNGSPNPYLTSALNSMSLIEHTSKERGQLNYAGFSDYKLIILEDLPTLNTGLQTALKEYIASGGNVLLFPNKNYDAAAYADFWRSLNMSRLGPMQEKEAEVFSIEESSFLFRDVFEQQDERRALPKVSAYKEWSGAGGAAQEVIMRLRNGKPFLGQISYASGHLILCYAPLDVEWNSLVTVGEVFVPLVFRSGLLSSVSDQPSLTIGEDEVIQVKKSVGIGEADYSIRGTVNFIPLQRSMGPNMMIDFQGQIEDNGYYELLERDSIAKVLAFNYNRKESNLATFTAQELKDLSGEGVAVMDIPPSKNAGAFIERSISGLELWKWCIFLVLLFLAAEQLLLRLWKTK